jgi:hypothetical protein
LLNLLNNVSLTELLSRLMLISPPSLTHVRYTLRVICGTWYQSFLGLIFVEEIGRRMGSRCVGACGVCQGCCLPISPSCAEQQVGDRYCTDNKKSCPPNCSTHDGPRVRGVLRRGSNYGRTYGSRNGGVAGGRCDGGHCFQLFRSDESL